ncbi:MAG: dTDP-4-dehydrorhamnose 3,5-epimerase [Parvularculaceae bacterium]
MDVATTDHPDVKLYAPRVFEDDRGYFYETYTQNKLEPHAPGLVFVQDNESYSKERYTVRGLHYQAPPFAQDKLVRVLRGRIFDVVVDVRRGSPRFGQWVGVELSAADRRQLLAPKGFLHGFATLEADCVVAYKVTAFYDKASDGAVHWASDDLRIDWPIPRDKAVLSAKDAAAPTFTDFQSPF